jgi:hypothetical protein
MAIFNRSPTISSKSNQLYWGLTYRFFLEHSSVQLSCNVGFPAICRTFVLMRISVYYIPWTWHAQDSICGNISQYIFWSCSAAESSSSSETSRVFSEVSNQRSLVSTASRTTLPIVCEQLLLNNSDKTHMQLFCSTGANRCILTIAPEAVIPRKRG